MDACSNPKCDFELPQKVRFCPYCGTENPLASATTVAAVSPVEPSRTELARSARPPAQILPESVLAKTIGASIAQPLVPDPDAANPAPPPPATPAKSPAAVPGTAATPDPKPVPVPVPVPIGRWLVLATVGLAVAAWFARPLLGPSDPCQSSSLSSELDQARTALGARDHRNALSKSTLALTTCAQGQRADELRRIQTDAVNGIVAEGRRCLKAMDVACLERVGADLALVAPHPAVKAFNADLDRDVGTRTNKELEAARHCIAIGDIECADQRMKLPLALRRNDTPVQALQEQLDKARSAADAAKTCLASTATDCAAVPLEGLRQASPKSPLIKGLERRAQLTTPPQEPAASASAPSSQAPQVAAPQLPPTPAPTAFTVTSHEIQLDLRQEQTASAKGYTIIYIRGAFSVKGDAPSPQRFFEKVLLLAPDGRTQVGGLTKYANTSTEGPGRITTPLPMRSNLAEGRYEVRHLLLVGDETKSERTAYFNYAGAVAPAPDPSAALVQRLVNEGERCRLERDCGCMKDKAVAVINIDPQNQWAVGMRKSASECARAKLEIR